MTTLIKPINNLNCSRMYLAVKDGNNSCLIYLISFSHISSDKPFHIVILYHSVSYTETREGPARVAWRQTGVVGNRHRAEQSRMAFQRWSVLLLFPHFLHSTGSFQHSYATVLNIFVGSTADFFPSIACFLKIWQAGLRCWMNSFWSAAIIWAAAH